MESQKRWLIDLAMSVTVIAPDPEAAQSLAHDAAMHKLGSDGSGVLVIQDVEMVENYGEEDYN